MTRPRRVARKKAQMHETASPRQPEPSAPVHNPTEFTDNMAEAAGLWQQVVQKMAMGFMGNPNVTIGHTDPLNITDTFMRLGTRLFSNPEHLYDSQLSLWKHHMHLWHATTQKLLGNPQAMLQDIQDRRFRDIAWSDSAVFDFIKRSYLINSDWVQTTIGNVKGLDNHTAQKVNFFTRQFMDAISPSNFFFTNPEVMRETLVSNGRNLVNGLQNMLDDVERGEGKLRISMTSDEAFELGVNLACSPGKVVYENDLMQLIQYAPATDTVFSTPLLIVPAWINKYYVLDMRPENSFVKWAVEKGYTVFMISWVNPDETLGRKGFDAYLSEGPLEALDVIQDITKSDQVNIVGYCLGGTLVSVMLAYLRAQHQDDRIGSATYLTTMVDFSDAGELSVFIDEQQIESLENRMSGKGYLEGSDLANTFNMLRANDLIWSFVVNNYLMGKDPFPFDLLYWNSDSTRMPAAMHSFYLRSMYQKNLLVKPGGIELLDTPINLTKITTPAYVLSTKEDHIAPWQSTYFATQIYDGPVTFVLAQSGHIAGVINPPSKKKYGYWTNDELPPRAQNWLDNAKAHDGSWWPHWHEWQKKLSGKKIKARKAGNAKYRPIENAPGAYARICI